MANNAKSVQEKADGKRKDTRARAWWCLVYLDNIMSDWLDRLRNLGVKCLVSPLHDKDANPDGTLKKPHYHVVLSFKNAVGYKRVIELFDAIGGVYPDPSKSMVDFIERCRIRDFEMAARYLCHLDHPNKHRYDIADVVSIGGLDYRLLIDAEAERTSTLLEIFGEMDDYHIDSYPKLIRHLEEAHPEWVTLAVGKYMRQVIAYAKGIHFEEGGGRSRRGGSTRVTKTNNSVPSSKPDDNKEDGAVGVA